MVVMLCIAHCLSVDGNSVQGRGLPTQKPSWAEETSPCPCPVMVPATFAALHGFAVPGALGQGPRCWASSAVGHTAAFVL